MHTLFKLDLINSVDHMYISSEILSQTKSYQKLQIILILKLRCSQKRYESTEVVRRTLGLTGPPAVPLTNKLKYKKDFY